MTDSVDGANGVDAEIGETDHADPTDAQRATEDADGADESEAVDAPARPDAGSQPRQRLDPADAFSLLGDAQRLAIVTTLHDADDQLSFSTLYDRVGGSDTGGFNYHLDRLVPHFVTKTETGYGLTAAGERIARAVAAGTYTDVPRLDAFAIEGTCHVCGATALTGAYEDERFTIECRECDERILGVAVPPSLVRGRDPAAFVDTFDQWARAQVDQARRGFCPDCGGAVTPSAEASDHGLAVDLFARFECTVCGRTVITSFGGLAARLPAVADFHRRRGERLLDRPYWEVEQCVTDEHTTVLQRDPPRVQVSFFAGDDVCHITFDETLSVTETRIVADADAEIAAEAES